MTAIRYTRPMHRPSTTRRDVRRRSTTIAFIAAAGRRLRPDRLEGHQRPLRCVARDASPRRGGHPRARLPAIGRVRPAGRPLIEVIFHELESEWALEIVRGVERVAGRSSPRGRADRDAGSADARAAAGSRRCWRAGRRASSRCSPTSASPMRDAAQDPRASRSSSSTRPGSRSTTRRRSARRTGTAA